MRVIVAALVLIGLTTVEPVMAQCISVPDTSASHHLQNQQQRVICLNRQLNDRTRRLEESRRFNHLQQDYDRLELQRRLDALPRPGNSAMGGGR